MSEKQLEEEMIYGAHSLVKKASKLFKDNLPDDTTAVLLDIKGLNPIQELKQQELIIPQELNSSMIIDGYELKKSLIQNNRTWLCSKKSKDYVLKFAPTEAIDDTINLAKTLLSMSQYLLKFDLVHGDIKPENIMISKRGDKNIFKIIDFGSMREIYSINSTAGTPSYLAPGRFSGGSIHEGSEIFSIGVTLYESLTQHYPYGEIEPFSNPIFKTPTPLSKYNKNIPNWFESIIMRSIERDFERRYKKYSEIKLSKEILTRLSYLQNVHLYSFYLLYLLY